MNQFSSRERSLIINRVEDDEFDLLVIGGGITGAGIALDASLRGFKVLLIEKKDFAWGTSSRSTKLIHGGLRYLKQLEVSLVREVGMERAIVYKNALHLVRPKRMLLPIVENGSLGKIMSSIGLWIYDFLAGVESTEKRTMLDKKETLKSEPLLRKDIILGGGLYFEYRTDDARLTIEIIKKAIEKGCIALNYFEATSLIYNNEKIYGIQAFDHLNDRTIRIKSRYVVNACGPWVDQIREMDKDGVQKKNLLLSKGVHLVVDRDKLPLNQAIYFDVSEDERMIFAIPRDQIVYVGTTDTIYDGEIDNPGISKEDVSYLLRSINYMFENIDLKEGDVQSTWSGLRPLINEEGKDSSEISRKDEIFESSSGLISIAGGKLTGYRKMSERVIDLLVKKERVDNKTRSYHLCKTGSERISGADFDTFEDLKSFRKSLAKYYSHLQISTDDIKSLIFKYGSNTDIILQKLESYDSHNHKSDLIRAEIWYAVTHEMCSTVCDFFIRRTGMLYFERPRIAEVMPIVLSEMSALLKWDKKRIEIEKTSFQSEFEEVLNFS